MLCAKVGKISGRVYLDEFVYDVDMLCREAHVDSRRSLKGIEVPPCGGIHATHQLV
jgi:hypothetical protein